MEEPSANQLNKQAFLQRKVENKRPISSTQPNLFRWKTIALILVSLIALILVIDILMYLYLNDHQEPPMNLTFMNNILELSSIVGTQDQIMNMIKSLSDADQDIGYQYASLLIKGDSGQFTFNSVVDGILGKGYTDLFYIFQLQQIATGKTSAIGLYAASQFKVPSSSDSDQNFNETLEYYTFEYGDNRISTLISIGQSATTENQDSKTKHTYSQKNAQSIFLKANETIGDDFDLLKCKSYRMLKEYDYLTFLEVLNITFSTTINQKSNQELAAQNTLSQFETIQEIKQTMDAKVRINIGTEKHEIWKCFHGVQTQQKLSEQLKLLMGGQIDIDGGQIRVKRFEIFHFYNAND